MKTIKYMLAILFSIAVAACGGGGGGGGSSATLISGTAAAGAPVVGYVSVRDSSNNTQPVRTNIPIEANGHYSVDVTGLTPPYAFLATGTVGGRTVSLYSAATSADEGKTINITPFTDLIIRNIAATAVDTYFANPANMANLTTAQLDAKRVALTTALAPALTAMGVSNSIDLLRATFNADSTGLDRFMDVVKVDTTTPSAVTISNILDAAAQLTMNTTAGGTTSGAISTASLSPTATPFDGMKATADALSALFATSLPSSTNPNLLALFTTTSFMHNGVGVSAFLTDMTTSAPLVGVKFTSLGLDSIDATGTIAKVHFTPINAAGQLLGRDQTGGVMHMWMIKNATTGLWQLDGNHRLAWVRVRTVAVKGACNPLSSLCPQVTTLATAPVYQTGLYVDIFNQGQQPIGSVVVKGNGLPAGGITLAVQTGQTWFAITTPNTIDGTVNTASRCTNYVLCNTQNWLMTDAEIAQVTPNSAYTVELWSNATTPVLMGTYTEIVPVAPVLNTAKAALAYPSLSGMINLTGTGASNLALTTTIPAGLWGNQVGAYVWQQDPLTFAMTANTGSWKDLNASTGTATSTLALTAPATGTWTGGNYTVRAFDQYGGELVTFYQ